MKIRLLSTILISLSLLFTVQAEIPYLRKQGTATQLIVNDKPFLMRGGELGNSSSSNIAYMHQLWPTLEQMNLNTILAPVYWDLIEPEEGQFDFSLVDDLIISARKRDIKLVLLWFASWKNSMSCYTPSWVKTNQQRFPRAKSAAGQSVEILSPFSSENLQADLKAFASLMKHLKEMDGEDNTVIMVQVENEIGMLPDARDYSKEATKAYKSFVPEALLDYLKNNKNDLKPEFKKLWEENGAKTTGTWQEVFGDTKSGEEIFMAWYFARCTQKIAHAGKEIYPLPMYINAALNRIGYAPGDYPSAGPLPHLMDVWKAGATDIDFLSPDIYFSEFEQWARLYDRGNNAFFIPEARFNAGIEFRMLYSFGEHYAMGFSPFSIESVANPANEPITKAYDLIIQLEPLILEHQGNGSMRGILLNNNNRVDTISLGGYTLIVKHEFNLGWSPGSKEEVWPEAGGLIICIGSGEYIFSGSGMEIRFKSENKKQPLAGIEKAEEGNYINGNWVSVRCLNGDQTHQGRHIRIPMDIYEIQKVKLYSYH